MNNEIKKYLERVDLNESTTDKKIMETEKNLKIIFPSDFKEFIRTYNGLEGEIGNNSYLVMWSLEDMIKLNEAYAINEFAPGLLLFGSDGGDTAYGYDYRNNKYNIIQIPFIGLELNELEFCASTLLSFFKHLYQN